MDYKKISLFIMIAGILILIGSSVYYFNNQSVAYEQRPLSRQNLFQDFGRNAQAKWAARDENMRRMIQRDKATDWLITGGIVLFAGIIIRFSAKTHKKPDVKE